LVAPLFDLSVDFLLGMIWVFKAMLEKCCDFNPKKRVLPVAPPIDLEVEFGVFDANIWVSMARFLVLRS
jgi:hypothetical protein